MTKKIRIGDVVKDSPIPPKAVRTRQEALDTFRAQVEESIANNLNLLDPNAVLRDIVADINKSKNEVVWALLGMSNRWGKWEVDHCNGRTSEVSQWIAGQVKDEFDKFMLETTREVLAEVQAITRNQLKKAFKAEIEAAIAYGIRNHVSEAVSNELNSIYGEVLQEFRDGTNKGE